MSDQNGAQQSPQHFLKGEVSSKPDSTPDSRAVSPCTSQQPPRQGGMLGGAGRVGVAAKSTTVHLRIAEAKNLPVMDMTSIISSECCDPFCSVRVDNKKVARTATQWRTLSPFWGEDFILHMPSGFGSISIYVFDEDLRSNDVIGKVSLDREAITLDPKGVDQWFAIEPVHKDQEIQGEIEVALRLETKPSQLKVEIIQARSLAAKDKLGKSDPFVSFKLNGRRHRTHVKKDTLFPKWKETFVVPLNQAPTDNDELVLTMWDWNRLIHNDFMGEVRIPLSDLAKGGAQQGWHRLKARQHKRSSEGDAGLGSIRLRVFIREHTVLPSCCYLPLINLFMESVEGPLKREQNAVTLLQEVMPDDASELATVMVRLYLGQGKVVDFLDTINIAELKRSEKATLFRGNSFATKCNDQFMKVVGLMYLRDVLQPILSKIFEEKKVTEINPTKLDEAEGNVDQVISDHTAILTGYISDAINAIVSSVRDCPPVMRLVFKKLLLRARQRFPQENPENKDVPYLAVSGFLFLRFFAPAILGPKLFLLRDEHPDETVARTLTLVAKAIQSMGNLGASIHSPKEAFMKPLHPLIMENIERVKGFLDNLIAIPNELENMEEQYYASHCVLRQGVVQFQKDQKKARDRLGGSFREKKKMVWLTRTTLEHAKVEKKERVKNERKIIEMADIRAVEELDSNAFKSNYGIKLIVAQDNTMVTYYLVPKDVNEQQQWLSALRKVCFANVDTLQYYHPGMYRLGKWSCCKKSHATDVGCSRTHTGVILGDFQDPLEPDTEAEALFTHLWNNFDYFRKAYCPQRVFPAKDLPNLDLMQTVEPPVQEPASAQKETEAIAQDSTAALRAPAVCTSSGELYFALLQGKPTEIDGAGQIEEVLSPLAPKLPVFGKLTDGTTTPKATAEGETSTEAATTAANDETSNPLCDRLLNELERLNFAHLKFRRFSRLTSSSLHPVARVTSTDKVN